MSATLRSVLDRIETDRGLPPDVVEQPRHTAVWRPCAMMAALTVVVGISGLRGADYPAHFVRAMAWERFGASVWSNVWYAGHSTVSYSVLSPAAMALVGPFVAVAIGSFVATYFFTRLTADLLPGPTTSLANYAFALAMFVNVVVGRAPFALGLAAALIAIRAWQHGHLAWAAVAAVLAPLFSPVAGAFLAIAAGAVLVAHGRRDRSTALHASAILGAAVAPIAVVGAVFGGTGWFPFRGGHFLACVIALTLVALAVRSRAVRVAAILSIASATILFVVPNPLGGNFIRLAQIVAVPLAVTALGSIPRRLLLPFGLLLVWGVAWSLSPGVVAAVDWWGDDSVDPAYHRPLIERVRMLNRDGEPLGRLEIPFTVNHWESLFVAPEVPFARGWERQVDLAHNADLYDGSLTADEYHAWVAANGVRWIALADAAIDHGGTAEERLLADASVGGIEWLRPVWSNEHWRLYEVVDYTPIVDPPAHLVEQGADWLVVRAPEAATVTIRYHYTEHLTITDPACVEPDPSGWIVARLPAGGEYRLTIDPTATLLGGARTCALNR